MDQKLNENLAFWEPGCRFACFSLSFFDIFESRLQICLYFIEFFDFFDFQAPWHHWPRIQSGPHPMARQPNGLETQWKASILGARVQICLFFIEFIIMFDSRLQICLYFIEFFDFFDFQAPRQLEFRLEGTRTSLSSGPESQTSQKTQWNTSKSAI